MCANMNFGRELFDVTNQYRFSKYQTHCTAPDKFTLVKRMSGKKAYALNGTQNRIFTGIIFQGNVFFFLLAFSEERR